MRSSYRDHRQESLMASLSVRPLCEVFERLQVVFIIDHFHESLDVVSNAAGHLGIGRSACSDRENLNYSVENVVHSTGAVTSTGKAIRVGHGKLRLIISELTLL